MKTLFITFILVLIPCLLNCEESPEDVYGRLRENLGALNTELNFRIGMDSGNIVVGFILGQNDDADNLFDKYKNIKSESNFVIYARNARAKNVAKKIIVSNDPGLPNIEGDSPEYGKKADIDKLSSDLKSKGLKFEIVEIKGSKDSMLVIGKNNKILSVIKSAIVKTVSDTNK